MRVTSRTWIILGLVVAVVGFAVLMVTIPQLQDAQTLARQLAAALDPEAARQMARLRQQYYASIAVIVAGLLAVFYGLTSMVSRSREPRPRV